MWHAEREGPLCSCATQDEGKHVDNRGSGEPGPVCVLRVWYSEPQSASPRRQPDRVYERMSLLSSSRRLEHANSPTKPSRAGDESARFSPDLVSLVSVAFSVMIMKVIDEF